MKKLFVSLILTGVFLPVFVLAGTFGNTDIGENSQTLWDTEPKIVGWLFTLSENADITSITAYLEQVSGGLEVKYAIYDSDFNKIDETNELSEFTGNGWYALNFDEPISLEAGDYHLLAMGNNQSQINGDVLYDPPDEYYGEFWEYLEVYEFPSSLEDSMGEGFYPAIYANYSEPPEPLFELPETSVGSTTGIVADLIESIGPFIWAFIGIPLGFVVVNRILKIIPK